MNARRYGKASTAFSAASVGSGFYGAVSARRR